jgi:hypothetical protein
MVMEVKIYSLFFFKKKTTSIACMNDGLLFVASHQLTPAAGGDNRLLLR